MQLMNWPTLRFWGWWGGGNFTDTWQVLTSADCYRSIGLEVYEIDNPCMIYAYGRPLLWTLAGLHIGASQTSLFGIIFLTIISGSIALIVKNLSYLPGKKALVTTLITASPPIMLLVDRGNFDSLIVFMMLIAAWAYSKGQSHIAIFLIFLSAIFKYYTAPLLLLMVFVSKGKYSKSAATLLSLVAYFSIWRDLKITQFTFTTGNPHLTFGLGHEFLYLSKYNSLEWLERFRYAGGFIWVLLCFGASILWLKKKTISFNTFKNNSFTRTLYVFSTTLILSCYVTGANADYRLIFLCISGITLLSIVRISESFDSIALHIVCGILWLTFPSDGYEIIGDALLSLYVGFTGAFLLKLNSGKKLNLFFK